MGSMEWELVTQMASAFVPGWEGRASVPVCFVPDSVIVCCSSPKAIKQWSNIFPLFSPEVIVLRTSPLNEETHTVRFLVFVFSGMKTT